MLLVISNVFAQKQIKFDGREKDKNGNINFVHVSAENKVAANDKEVKDLLIQICKPNTHVSFKQLRNYTDNLGFTHYIYQAYHDGLEMKGMCYSIHAKDNTIQYANGTFVNIANTKTTPQISGQTAIKAATEFYKKTFINATIKLVTNVELLFCNNPLADDSKYFLAYKIFVQSNTIAGDYYLYINAVNGDVLQRESLVCTAHTNSKLPPPNANGTAQTRYSGTQNFITDVFNGSFRLRENRNNVNILTLNAQHQTDETNIVNTATDFVDNDNNWTAAETGTDQYATDIHWGAEKVLDYWQQVQGRNSIDGNGLQIKSFVHVGNCYDNAYWHPNYYSMFYGDGCSYFSPLSSLDVCAHELGHGICQFTSNLSYSYGTESSAMNEGFSDIWGASVEAWAAPNKQRWLIGEEITLISPGYLRSMSNPPSGAFQPSSDTYGDVNWNNQPDAHYRSGVLNKWYYLLSDGGTGTNGIGNTYSVNCIGIDHASKIAYRTEQLLNSSANYALGRTMSIQAARDLYGIGSCEEINVIKAWYAVGVGANTNATCAGLPNPLNNASLNGPLSFCNTGNYTVDNLPAGATVVWSSGNTSIAAVSNTGVATATTAANNSSFQVLATVSLNTCYGVFTKNLFLNVTANYANTNPLANVTVINGLSTFCTTTTYTIPNVPAGASVYWQSSNTAIATVQNTGTASTTATRVADGTCTITATVGFTNCLTTFITTLTKNVTTYSIPTPDIVNDGFVPNPICVNDLFGAKVTPIAGATYFWSTAKFSKIAIVSGQGTPNVVLKALNYGTDFIYVTIQTPCGVLQNIKYYRIGYLFTKPSNITSQVINSNCSIQIRQYNVTPTQPFPAGTIYHWTITYSNGLVFNYTGLPITHSYQGIPSATVEVYAQTTCGNTEPLTFTEQLPPTCKELTVGNTTEENKEYIKILPNPSNGIFTIQLNSSAKEKAIKEVIIKDKMGMLVYQQKFAANQQQQTINLAGKPTDIYMVQIFDGTNWVTQKLSLQK